MGNLGFTDTATTEVQTAHVSLEKSKEVAPHVYGQFLEHIYGAVVGGISGQVLRSPSFEEQSLDQYTQFEHVWGMWNVKNDVLTGHWYDWIESKSQVFFGPEIEGDFVLEFEARKNIQGWHSLIIALRVQDDQNQLRWNLDNWGGLRPSAAILKDGNLTDIDEADGDTTLETGNWYIIKIECKDNQFKGYVNEELIVEFSDETWNKGRFGIGTLLCEASFRNIEIMQDGAVIWRDELEQSSKEISPGWNIEKAPEAAEVYFDHDFPANSTRAIRINSKIGDVQIQQNSVPIHQGTTYEGSLWLRGYTEKLTVSLNGQEQVIDVLPDEEVDEYEHEDHWRERKFTFQAKESTPDATFDIHFQSPTSMSIDLVTLFPEETPFRKTVYNTVDAINPSFIRWPGGTFSERYHWKDGIGPLRERQTAANGIWGGLDPNFFGTAEFIKLCQQTGAEPIIVLNMGAHVQNEYAEDYLEAALSWIEYCNGDEFTKWGAIRAFHGYEEPFNVKYWELGNEAWGMGLERYLDYIQVFSERIRDRWPEIELIACGSGAYDQEWNEKILKEGAEYFDYLSVHHYCHDQEMDKVFYDAHAWPAFLDKTGELIKKSDNPDVKIAVTEWNQQSTTWRTGIYAGTILNEFEKRPDLIEMACPALWIREEGAPHWDNAFINHDGYTAWTAPNYDVMKLYRDHPVKKTLEIEYEGPLNIFAGIDEENHIILRVVNPSNTSLHLNLEGLSLNQKRPIRGWVIQGDSPDSTKQEGLRHSDFDFTDPLVIEPLSVTLMKFSQEMDPSINQ